MCRLFRSTIWKAICWRRCWKIIRRNIRLWRCWYPAAIRSWLASPASVSTPCWASQLTMRRGKLLIKPPSCSVWIIPAAQCCRSWLRRARKGALCSRVRWPIVRGWILASPAWKPLRRILSAITAMMIKRVPISPAPLKMRWWIRWWSSANARWIKPALSVWWWRAA